MTRTAGQNESCSRADHEAVLYASGELSENELATYEPHLSECPACTAAVAEMRAWDGAGAALPARRPSVATLDAISAAARKHVAGRQSAPESAPWPQRVMDWLGLTRRTPVPAFGWSFMVVLLAVTITYLGGYDGGSTTIPQSQLIAWDYSDSAVDVTTEDVASAEYILPDGGWESSDYESVNYDLVALAGDIDDLASQIDEF